MHGQNHIKFSSNILTIYMYLTWCICWCNKRKINPKCTA